MKNTHSLPNFYSITPSYVRYDKELTNFDKVLYGEISALTNAKGYCFSYNKYFMSAFGVSEMTIQRSLKRLEKQKVIFVDIERNPLTNQFLIRKIYLILDKNTPPHKNEGTPTHKNEGVMRVNALSLNNNTRVNNNTYKYSSYNSLKPKDIEVDWLEDYIENMD